MRDEFLAAFGSPIGKKILTGITGLGLTLTKALTELISITNSYTLSMADLDTVLNLAARKKLELRTAAETSPRPPSCRPSARSAASS